MWFKRVLDQICLHGGPVVLVGEPEWGAPYLIERLNELRRPLVWLWLTERDRSDEVAQGNKLADAIRRAVQTELFGYGLPYSYGLSVVQNYLELLGPFVFALSGAEHSPELARRLLEIGGENLCVAAFMQHPEGELPENTLVLSPETLRLTAEEAQALTHGRLSGSETTSLLEGTRGAYEPFTVALRKRAGFAIPLRPTPDGPRFPSAHETKVDAEALLMALVSRERWLEALELAAEVLPQRVPAILLEAGHHFHERGLHQRLWVTLERLVTPVASDPTILYWRLSAASRLGKAEVMRAAVEAYLSEHPEAAELRALYAGTLAPANRYVAEAKSAAEVTRSAFTLYQYGRALAHHDPLAGETVLREAVALAEQGGRPYEIVRNTWALAARLTALGRYREGVFWSRWAVEKYEGSPRGGDVQLWLLSVNEWVFGRILTGEMEGLEALLLEVETHLDRVSPPLTRLFRSTLGDYYLASGAPERAYSYYLKNWQGAARSQLGNEAYALVRALLELERYSEALHVAEQAYYLTKGDDYVHTSSAQLAYGMALSFTRAKDALVQLKEAWQRSQAPLAAIPLAQAGLYLARTHVLLGDEGGALGALRDSRAGLHELGESGLALLAGPEHAFHDVRRLLCVRQESLELSLLGVPQVRLNGWPLDLPLRHLEVLCLLALHPQGLSGEAFVLQLYGDKGQSSNLKATISKLRRTVPIGAQPYRLLAPLQADFIEAERLLDKGMVREATGLYRGALLSHSNAPGVVEHREALEEGIRQAVLQGKDEEALLAFAEVLGDDLEVWEHTLLTLPTSDPRHAPVHARVHRIRRAWTVDA